MLYLCPNRSDFVNQMPIFDEWGLRPAGLQGPRENPVVVAALVVGQGDSSSSGGAGRHEPLEAEAAPAEVIALGGAHEGAAPEACAAVAEGGEQLPAAPAAETPEAPATLLGEATGSAHQADAPDAGRLIALPRHRLTPALDSWVASAWTSRPSGREGRPWVTITLVAC